ncbi:MAG: pseudouridine synthase [Candidatus Promineifilaceae bacterium]
MQERLQKIMARSNIGSRRHNEELIKQGIVSVNGVRAKLGDKADAEIDTITVRGEPLKFQKYRYIMVNKPKGIISSTEDEESRRTVRDLVSVEGHLFTVGRLDKQSEGLILLTNDGMLANRLTHPRYEHKKLYRVWVERRPTREALEQWRKGVLLDEKMTAPAEVKVVDDSKYTVELLIGMREGRKRQIRRVAELLGHPVRKLVREKIGPLRLKDVEMGKWRDLTERELKSLFKAARIPSPRERHFVKNKPNIKGKRRR